MSDRKRKSKNSSPWFRMYDEILDDAKVQRLQGEMFKTWVNILCLARRSGGVLPPLAEMAFSLRLPEKECEKRIAALIKNGLIDEFDGPDGGTRSPHNWSERQHDSDVSTDRVRAFRQRQKERDGTLNETFHETVSEAFLSVSVSESEYVGNNPPLPVEDLQDRERRQRPRLAAIAGGRR